MGIYEVLHVSVDEAVKCEVSHSESGTWPGLAGPHQIVSSFHKSTNLQPGCRQHLLTRHVHNSRVSVLSSCHIESIVFVCTVCAPPPYF